MLLQVQQELSPWLAVVRIRKRPGRNDLVLARRVGRCSFREASTIPGEQDQQKETAKEAAIVEPQQGMTRCKACQAPRGTRAVLSHVLLHRQTKAFPSRLLTSSPSLLKISSFKCFPPHLDSKKGSWKENGRSGTWSCFGCLSICRRSKFEGHTDNEQSKRPLPGTIICAAPVGF